MPAKRAATIPAEFAREHIRLIRAQKKLIQEKALILRRRQTLLEFRIRQFVKLHRKDGNWDSRQSSAQFAAYMSLHGEFRYRIFRLTGRFSGVKKGSDFYT